MVKLFVCYANLTKSRHNSLFHNVKQPDRLGIFTNASIVEISVAMHYNRDNNVLFSDSICTQSGAGGKGVGAMWCLAAACITQVSSVLVAEVQTEATLMLGTTQRERKKALSKFPLLNYSTRGEI